MKRISRKQRAKLQKVGIGLGIAAGVAGLGILLGSIVAGDYARKCEKYGLGGGYLAVRL